MWWEKNSLEELRKTTKKPAMICGVLVEAGVA
jgi:hypothetical protein